MLTGPNLTLAQASMQTPYFHDAERARCIDSNALLLHVLRCGANDVQMLGGHSEVDNRAVRQHVAIVPQWQLL